MLGFRLDGIRRFTWPEAIVAGAVCMPHAWGHNRPCTRQRIAHATPGVSMNDLADVGRIDELTGNAVLNGYAVRVEALAPPA